MNVRRIRFRIPLEQPGEFILDLPIDARHLTFGSKADELNLWVTTSPDVPKGQVRFWLAFTGDVVVGPVTFVGTCVTHGGTIVWHLFRKESYIP